MPQSKSHENSNQASSFGHAERNHKRQKRKGSRHRTLVIARGRHSAMRVLVQCTQSPSPGAAWRVSPSETSKSLLCQLTGQHVYIQIRFEIFGFYGNLLDYNSQGHDRRQRVQNFSWVLFMGRHVCRSGGHVPSWIRGESHHPIGCTDMRPIHPSYTMKLHLHGGKIGRRNLRKDVCPNRLAG